METLEYHYEMEWLQFLLDDKRRYHKFPPQLKPELNQLVSELCQNLSLSNEIEFTCLINVERFFHIFFQRLESQVGQEEHLWEQALEDVESQTVPFIMNMVNICAKYVDNTGDIPIPIFLQLLNNCFRPCDLNSFKETEILVLKSIDFEIEPPVAYYSARYFLQMVVTNMNIDDVNLKPILIELLRVSILRRIEIYEEMDENIISHNKFQNDQTLLGIASVLTSFIVLKYSMHIVSELLEMLSAASHISSKSILFLSSRIIKLEHNDVD